MRSLTAISDIDPASGARFTRAGAADGDRAFRAAVRHSRHVRILRIAVPAAVVLVVVGAIGFPVLVNPLRALSKIPVDIGSWSCPAPRS